MDIFIGNLPGSKYEPEILGLLKNVERHAKTEIKSPIHKHRESGYFCIATIKQDKIARRFIKKFNQKSPYGHKLMIREYVHRCYGNERRDINWREMKWQGHEKRGRDRRSFIAQTEI
jgi:hypothetical protein